ncbi:MAG: glycosyltransferase family 4 protein [Thermodesulfobacteriota bacterium]|nr:glycosyltransferase family 4 protein [Thermodesulfobacteriota bacterium]
MRILHILSQTPDFTGSGKYIQAIMKCAAGKGHDNFLVAGIQENFVLDSSIISPENTLFVRFKSKELDYPIPGMSDVMPYKSTLFSTLTEDQIKNYKSAFKKVILRAYEMFMPDIIHTHHLWVASKVARVQLPDLPMVTTCHGTCLRQFSLCPNLGEDVKKSCRNIDRVMSLSHFQKQEIQRIHSIDPGKIDIVGGGYDDSLFFNDTKASKGVVEMLYAGKLSRAKGVPWLLQSLDKIKHLPWRLHLAGTSSGREKEECLSLAGKLNNRVIVHGSLNHRKLATLMRKTHVFILPSFFEGLPLVLMEALASGCRIITTSLPGTREVLGDSSTRMVDLVELPILETIDSPYERDMVHLRERLARVIEKVVKKTIENRQPDMEAALKITKKYTWEKVFSRIEKVYEKAFKNF